jgi:hypothetical protein
MNPEYDIAKTRNTECVDFYTSVFSSIAYDNHRVRGSDGQCSFFPYVGVLCHT